MKHFALKRILTAALSAAMLVGAAWAVDPVATTPPAERIPSTILVYGQAAELGENQVTLENSNESDPYQKITVNVTEDTLILDAVSGEARTFADLKQGENLYAYVSPAMTRSIPPISNGALILCNIPADYAVPTYSEVERVTVAEDGAISLLTDRAVILHLSAETEIVAGPGREAVKAADIVPGDRVLSWYSVVALSFPAQANPSKVMVFPNGYTGYVSADEAGIFVNGTKLELTAAEMPKLVDGELQVPLRKVAEALGCEVVWNQETNSVSVTQDGDMVIYDVSLNGEGSFGDGTFVLAGEAVDGVTFVSLSLITPRHPLKVVTAG